LCQAFAFADVSKIPIITKAAAALFCPNSQR
jgi:hypothetical protein